MVLLFKMALLFKTLYTKKINAIKNIIGRKNINRIKILKWYKKYKGYKKKKYKWYEYFFLFTLNIQNTYFNVHIGSNMNKLSFKFLIWFIFRVNGKVYIGLHNIFLKPLKIFLVYCK